MFDEPFATGRSFIHRIDPRHRIVIAVVYSFVVALTDRFAPLTGALIVSLALAALARLRPAAVWRRLKVVLGFLALIWIVLPLTTGTPFLARIGPMGISTAGVLLAARISLKTTAILIEFTALVATMPLATLGHALGQVKMPEKLVYLVLMTYRYIHLLENEYQRTVRAIRLRGFLPGTNVHTYKTYAYLIGMLFVRSVARAERIEWAMRCRGFRGRFYHLVDFVPTPATWTFSAMMGIIIFWIAFLEWGPHLW
ncbi:MAG: cobalt ECF transporter T component CbiQ [Deltaproteobacteria bacterium]|nr:MAG: cobalt ECF transporter T component CbiQ [Deltaproteobacteria bacterium]